VKKRLFVAAVVVALFLPFRENDDPARGAEATAGWQVEWERTLEAAGIRGYGADPQGHQRSLEEKMRGWRLEIRRQVELF